MSKKPLLPPLGPNDEAQKLAEQIQIAVSNVIVKPISENKRIKVAIVIKYNDPELDYSETMIALTPSYDYAKEGPDAIIKILNDAINSLK